LKPTVAIFDFASCEGCQLQIVNLEEQILDLVEKVDVVSFREAMKEHSDQYDLAFVEGSIQRPMDIKRLKEIRSKAKILVALGDCASTGCINKLRNASPISASLEEVYAKHYPNKSRIFDLGKTKALNEVVTVDFYIRGCPVRKEQLLYYINRLSWMPLHTLMDSRFEVTEKPIPIDDRSLVLYNPHKCILCRRCDVLCRDALGVDALGMVGKGPEIVVSTPKNIGFDNNGCIRCGQCIASCSCGSLETKSCIPRLVEDLAEKTGMKMAIDSIVLASYVEKNIFLQEAEPSIVERTLIGALKEAGFDEVIQYDRFLMESLKRDAANGKPGGKKMLSWCKAAFNYAQSRIPESKVARSEENSPWNLLIKEADGTSVCVLSPCTALKGVEGLTHVLSAMELDELFKKLEIDPEFSKPRGYEFDRAKIGGGHPGFGSVKLSEAANVYSQRISKGVVTRVEGVTEGLIELYPCIDRCISGGGNYPTVKKEDVQNRRKWLSVLWEANV
jgi:coenzyme F420-reducing hydrogenase gamma subunit